MDSVITQLCVFPVKSLRGIILETATLTGHGLAGDRDWLVLDSAGRFLGQRNIPAMATVGTALQGSELVLSREGLEDCRVAIDGTDGERRVTEVWGDRCEVIDQGEAAAAWLARALGTDDPPRLVRMAPGYARPQKKPERYGAGTTTFFADTAPFLVTNVRSLIALNAALAEAGREAVPMDRFRANIVIEGLEAFAEHGVKTLEGPGYRLGLRYPRERCVMTTIDQATGARDPRGEPFATLRRINPMPDNPRGPAFGELAVLEAGDGAAIAVGDRLSAGG